MRLFHRTVFAALACLMLLFIAGEVRADPLTLTVTNPTGTATPGSTINLLVSAFNSGTDSATPFTISGFFADYNIPAGSIFSAAPFNANFFNQAVASGETLGPLTAFSFTVAGDAMPDQVVAGFFYFTYFGSTGTEVSDNVVFGYKVVAPPSPVPEPATMLLLGTGMAGISGVIRRGRQRKEK